MPNRAAACLGRKEGEMFANCHSILRTIARRSDCLLPGLVVPSVLPEIYLATLAASTFLMVCSAALGRPCLLAIKRAALLMLIPAYDEA